MKDRVLREQLEGGDVLRHMVNQLDAENRFLLAEKNRLFAENALLAHKCKVLQELNEELAARCQELRVLLEKPNEHS